DYMKLPYRMEIIPDADEGGFSVSFPELPGCLTCADTMEKALSNARDAKKEWLKTAIECNLEIPEPGDADVEPFRLDLPRSLHRRLSENARREGVSIDRYCLYLLTKNDSAETGQQNYEK
ncbi:MAG: type II toxin-antitoxin system HicB family antitoxin, partial [Ruminiclostridium sp.]|nr:type II toxin-antitoxin system HicB family antitoxin [Ruminiclostridium sp.]